MACLQSVRVMAHQDVKQQKIDRRDEARGKGKAAMSPAKSKCKKPVQKKIRTDCQKTYDHRRIAFADRVERRRQHFQHRVRNKTDRVKFQRARSLSRHFGSEPSVLVNDADDRRCKHCEPYGRWDRQQEGEPHPTRKDCTKLVRVSDGSTLRYQWKSNCPDRDTEDSQRQLHQPKCNVEPAHRSVSKTGCESAV